MELTDKEYLILASIGELKIAKEYLKGTIREIVAHGMDAHNKDSSWNPMMNEVLACEAILDLELTDRMDCDGASAYAYKNDYDDKFIIFIYNSSSWLEPVQSLLSGQSRMLREASKFLQKNKGEGSCTVTGYSLGGALAMYAAADSEGVQGVVFDAPGMSAVLTEEQNDNLQIKNILAYNGLISALGQHEEELLFAVKIGEDDDWLDPHARWQPRFRFTGNGQVITGEPSVVYVLLSKLNQLTTEHTQAIEETLHAFGESAGLEDWTVMNPGYAVFMLIDQLDAGKVSNALAKLIQRYNGWIDTLFKDWLLETSNNPKNSYFDDISDKVTTSIEAAVTTAANMAENVYQCTEAVLSILVTCGPEGDGISDLLDEGLTKFTQALNSRLDKLSEQISAHLDHVIADQMNQLLSLPEIAFDF